MNAMQPSFMQTQSPFGAQMSAMSPFAMQAQMNALQQQYAMQAQLLALQQQYALQAQLLAAQQYGLSPNALSGLGPQISPATQALPPASAQQSVSRSRSTAQRRRAAAALAQRVAP
jgi:hypothetical protein